VSTAEAMQNIDGARRHHDQTCRYGGSAIEVHMNPADAERLGFGDREIVCGLTLVHDPKQRAGLIRVYCDVELGGQGAPSETVEAVSTTTVPRREAPLAA
jgi:hypothetical protein